MLKLEKRAGITAYSADGGGSDTRSGGKLRLCHAVVGEQFTQINFYHVRPPKVYS